MEMFVFISSLLSLNGKTMARVEDFLMTLDCTEEVAGYIETLHRGAETCETVVKKINEMFLEQLKNE